jgi:hypothetical protein
MHLHVTTAIEIEAKPDLVWAALIDFSSYADWNPFVRSIEGSPVLGAQLRVTIEPPGGRRMSFRPHVMTVTEMRELRWKGKLFAQGLFDGEHYFQLEPVGVNRTRLLHGEQFSGLLVRSMRRSLTGTTRLGFEAMNRALKRRSESWQPSVQECSDSHAGYVAQAHRLRSPSVHATARQASGNHPLS